MTARPTGIDLPKEGGIGSLPTQPSVRFNLERNTVHQYSKLTMQNTFNIAPNQLLDQYVGEVKAVYY